MTLTPTNLNVYQIRFQYLGAGGIEYFVENPDTARMVLVHRVKWAGLNTTTTLLNPSFPQRWHVANTTNNTAIAISGASVLLGLEGKRVPIGPPWATANTKASITTETNILTLKMATTYNGVTSRILGDIVQLGAAMATNTNGVGILRATLNATLGGTPSFSPLSGSTADNGTTITNGQSSISVDTAGTTVTGGTRIWASVVTNAGNYNEDTTEVPVLLVPGDTLTLSMQCTTSATVGVAVALVEDI